MAFTARSLITQSLQDAGILAQGESLSANDGEYCLGHLARIFDKWNAERAGVYASRFTTYTLTASLNPQTIGPVGATFTTDQRPVTIDGANLVLNDVTPNVKVPINVRDEFWYGALVTPALTSTMPSDLYYQPDWPLGKIYLWPVPTAAYGLELLTRVVLADLTLDDVFTMPPGYRDAVTRTLAENVAPGYGQTIPQDYKDLAREARGIVFANNDVPRSLSTRDAGMPSGGGGQRATFNYRNGLDNR